MPQICRSPAGLRSPPCCSDSLSLRTCPPWLDLHLGAGQARPEGASFGLSQPGRCLETGSQGGGRRGAEQQPRLVGGCGAVLGAACPSPIVHTYCVPRESAESPGVLGMGLAALPRCPVGRCGGDVLSHCTSLPSRPCLPASPWHLWRVAWRLEQQPSHVLRESSCDTTSGLGRSPTPLATSQPRCVAAGPLPWCWIQGPGLPGVPGMHPLGHDGPAVRCGAGLWDGASVLR